MSDHSGIEWTESTWNPVVGCTHVSAGCDFCYAAREASGRLSATPLYAGLARGGKFTGEVRLVEKRLVDPMRWQKPRRIFVNSMSDLFHEGVPDSFIAGVWAVMHQTPRHTYQVLTKRHGRMRSLLGSAEFIELVQAAVDELHDDPDDQLLREPWPPRNVWLGVSVESQKWADVRVPALLDTPAAVRFVSAEPLLGPVDLNWCGGVSALDRDWCAGTGAPHPLLDWVIVGGESGPSARPMHPDWARAIRDQCEDARVPLFFKQWGEWAPVGPQYEVDGDDGEAAEEAITEAAHLEVVEGKRVVALERTGHVAEGYQPTDSRTWLMARLGKRAAGRVLDGRTWDGYPVAHGLVPVGVSGGGPPGGESP